MILPEYFYFPDFHFILVIGLSQFSKVGKKGAVYIPKRICEQLGIKEDDRVLMRVEGDKLVLEFIPDPFSLAAKVRKWAKTTVEEFERESEEEQNELFSN
ncbi:AbrB/MazE/SpoVT family DNA-binding domain-containing protein [Candidatus Bathyarchaeota archaeon]|nr:AbrB/MazE/SpoVT family DNA-binding domain-containing protein [Candidatus Bathyarchaeota archaeon]